MEQFEHDLANALKALAASQWDTPYTAHGRSGHNFSYRIDEEFILVFRRETDRTAEGKPLVVHFYLKTIERVKK